ncbi:iron complex outermembrane recepter protein [Pararobbsia alpina]|uniref:TonB-dependent receptor plug domain-containing protein n=1 Tax=Pararobbsia alpina TaxID=621374 RepID=UPI0039A50E9D
MKQKVLVSAIKKIVGAELLLSAAFVPVAFAQTAPTDAGTANPDATKLERVEITGSLIKKADKTGNTTVQSVSAKEIEDSGYTTVGDFLRGTSANDASSWGQTTMNGTAPGGAGIALRGLSEKYTLVLVDGQRVANYALAVNFTDTFFDVNTIPLNIVDHIDIVKTGAVSQYGSDAIAGVVNIITKKNYHGLEITSDLGKAQHPGDATGTFGILGGFGDLNADRYNITAAASYYRDTGSRLSDRDMSSSSDFSRFPGGMAQPTGPNQQNFWQTSPTTTQALSPCPPGAIGTSDSTVCNYNTQHNYSLIPETTRLNAKIHGLFKVTDDVQAYADFWVSRNETVQYSGIASATGISNVFNLVPGQLTPLNNTVPAGNPYNPFGVDTPINYSFLNDQTAVDTVSTYWKASTGVKGSFSVPKFGDWDWDVQYGHSQSVVSSTYENTLNVNAWESALANGTLNFSNPVYPAGLFEDDNQSAISKLDSVTATTSTTNLFTLPAGDVGFGVGTEFRHETDIINPTTLANQGITAPARIQSVDGERNIAAVYYQFDIPLIKNLTFTQSGRYDHYSDFGGAFSPNFALRYQPVSMLTTYASYGRGFRAPTAVENSQATFISHQTLSDKNAPGGAQSIFASEYNAGNPNLQPEHTKNYNIGFALSPDSTTDFGAAFYKVKIDGVIGTTDPQALLDANDPSTVIRNADGSLRYINMQFQNLGSLDTDGFDFDFRKSLSTGFGTFTLAGDWAYVWHFKLTQPGGGGTQDFAGNNGALNQPFGASNPRWKGNTSLTWDYAKFTTTLTWQYTGPYSNIIADQIGLGGTGSVASYSQFNLFTSYRGFKNWTIYAGIDNLFDKAPPFDPVWTLNPDLTGYDQSLYTNLGRFFQIGATYRFK